MTKKSKPPVKTLTISGVIGISVIVLIFTGGALFETFAETVPQSDELEVPIPTIADRDNPTTVKETDEMTANDGSDRTTNVPDLTDEEEEILEDVDELLNMTETSNDPPVEQVCDILNLFCGTANTVGLEANIVKIDSMGFEFNETLTFDVPLASLFIEETTDIDFRNGLIELDLNLITEPDTFVFGAGIFGVNISNTEILSVDLEADGLTDNDGKIRLSFKPDPINGSPQILSDLFTFKFDTHFERFSDESITTLSFIIKSLDIESATDQRNGLTNQEIFSMDIFRDDIQIFIEDIDGNEIRSYPQDDSFKVTSIERSQSFAYSCTNPNNPSAPTLSGRTGYGGTGCSGLGGGSKTQVAPTVSSVKLFDGSGIIINAGAGTGVILDELLFRNANYTVTSSHGNFDIEAPKSQVNYNYSCWTEEGATYTRVTGSVTNTIRPIAWDYYQAIPNGSFTTVCNFPAQ